LSKNAAPTANTAAAQAVSIAAVRSRMSNSSMARKSMRGMIAIERLPQTGVPVASASISQSDVGGRDARRAGDATLTQSMRANARSLTW
jgi:hypothetical protein